MRPLFEPGHRYVKPSTCDDRPWIYAYYDDPPEDNTAGKWMVFTDTINVDRVWEIIYHATVTGKLGIASKVSTNYRLREVRSVVGTRVICVYTKDYADIEDVRRVLRALRELGFTETLHYKEDNATRKNMYGEGSTLYTSRSGVTFVQTRAPVA